MDGTQDAARERTAQARTDVHGDEPAPPPLSRRTVRRLSWTLAWCIPLIALIVGIALTVTGSIEQLEPMGEGSYEVTLLAVWPAGVAFLASGVLGLTAAAIATALVTTVPAR